MNTLENVILAMFLHFTHCSTTASRHEVICMMNFLFLRNSSPATWQLGKVISPSDTDKYLLFDSKVLDIASPRTQPDVRKKR